MRKKKINGPPLQPSLPSVRRISRRQPVRLVKFRGPRMACGASEYMPSTSM